MGVVRYPKLQNVAWLRREYIDKGRSMKAIGEKAGCSGATVSAALRRHRIIVDPPGPTGPVDLTPFFSRQAPTPAAGCRCERPLHDEEGLCVKCGR